MKILHVFKSFKVLEWSVAQSKLAESDFAQIFLSNMPPLKLNADSQQQVFQNVSSLPYHVVIYVFTSDNPTILYNLLINDVKLQLKLWG